MNKKTEIQQNFLNEIKNLIPLKTNVVYELADILNISGDSVYRRLSGKTALTINEIVLLCNHFKISFDIFANANKNITFSYDSLGSDNIGFENYLFQILEDMILIEKSKNKQIIYAAIDIPIFHHFNYPELSAFKMFYWSKEFVNVPFLRNKKFNTKHISKEFAEMGKKIYKTYCKIPSIEIWTYETVNSLIKQIEFYWDTGNFESKNDALIVCEQAKTEIDNIKKQAENNNKIISGIKNKESEFTLLNSDIEIGNNCIFTKKAGIESIYFSVHTFNKIKTSNKKFVKDTKSWLDNLMKKSNQISGISQINRYKFFEKAFFKINKLYNKIKNEK